MRKLREKVKTKLQQFGRKVGGGSVRVQKGLEEILKKKAKIKKMKENLGRVS